ncbi:MAG: class I SAM-dependent methyltransferase [Gammaproteobacteria bacterium]
MTTPESSKDNQWNDYWNNDGAKGEVFVGADGSAHPRIAAWWHSHFEHAPSGDIVDLACGAGSVFAHLPDHHKYRLFGADISAEALEIMRQRVPGVTTTVCSADNLPYEDGQFDVVCSQFGVEYAGLKAFEEAARILKPGGKLFILCHYENGYIDARNRAHLEQARTLVSSDFIAKALNLIDATYAGDQDKLNKAIAEFSPAEQTLSQACSALSEGIHLHLYAGFRQLYERRAQYDQADIENWLRDMDKDVEHNILRLEHMCRAASDDRTMQDVVARLEASGCSHVQHEPLTFKEHSQPVAWALTLTR